MKKHLLMLLAAGSMVFSACSEDTGTTTETNENDSSTPDSASGTDTSATSSTYDARYQDRANRLSQRVSQDLRLDSATESRIRTVYFNRARQMGELETRFSSTNRSAGLAADSADRANERLMSGDMEVSSTETAYSPAYYSELEKINSNADAEMRGFLSAEQYNLYNANRQKYYDMDKGYINQAAGTSKDAKFKTDDMKIKRDGDELKIKTDNMKIKKEGDESKMKTDDLKIKREGDESKLKADDLKIKRESDEMKVKTDDSKIKVEN